VVAPPAVLRAHVFFDGQNLFKTAKAAFGYTYPNYDPIALARFVCAQKNLQCDKIHFYTGAHRQNENAFWYDFWTRKLGALGTRGVDVYSRSLAYCDEKVTLPDGTTTTVRLPREKGVDVRLALDVVRFAREGAYEVAILFSQDQDLSEAVKEIHRIRDEESRWMKAYCAFPVAPNGRHRPSVNGAGAIKLTKADYDACIDPRDYRKP
jgi:uncharacterized LabA/DUF88 family protein